MTLTAVSSTNNDMAPVTLLSHRFGAEQETCIITQLKECQGDYILLRSLFMVNNLKYSKFYFHGRETVLS